LDIIRKNYDAQNNELDNRNEFMVEVVGQQLQIQFECLEDDYTECLKNDFCKTEYSAILAVCRLFFRTDAESLDAGGSAAYGVDRPERPFEASRLAA
jgi:hypothetical protein